MLKYFGIKYCDVNILPWIGSTKMKMIDDDDGEDRQRYKANVAKC